MKNVSLATRGARTPQRARIAIAIATVLGSMLGATDASAQVLEEIVVTARFREESLQEIPISISAITGSALDANGATDVVDIGDWAPNVVIDHLGAGWGPTVAASIRGIGYGDFKAVQEPTVSIYVDDVVLGRPTGAVMDLMDLERVEVLRGPQGTLFGKNAVGGTVRLISRKPTGDGPGSLEVTRGEYNRLDVRGSFETTLVDEKLFGRVSFASKKRDGWVNVVDFSCQMERNGTPQLAGLNDGIGGWNDPDGAGPIVGTPIAAPVGSAADNAFALPTLVSPLGTDKGCIVDTLGDENLEAARGVLRFVPNDRFEITIATDFMDQQQKGPADHLQAAVTTLPLVTNFNNQTGRRRWGVPWDARFVSGDPRVNYSSFNNPIDGIETPNINDVTHYGTSATFDWSLSNDLSLKLILAQREFEAQFGRDSDASPLPINHTLDTLRSDQVTAELRVSGTLFEGRTDWTAGVFSFDADDFNSNISILFPGQLPTSDIDRVDEQTTKNTGVFINTVTRLTDDLSLSLGLRQTSDEKTVVQRRFRRDETMLWVPRPVTTEADEVTPMVSLSYQANDNIMLYGTYQEGFRGGGANQRPANVNQVVPFGPEYLDNLEFGIKSDLGGNVRLNASIFDMTYTDMQLGAVTADATGAVAFLTANAGKAKISGIELEVQGAIGERWVLDATIGTLDFEYKDLGAASAAAIQAAGLGTGLAQPSLDDVAPRTPDYTATFGFNYLIDLPGDSSLTWRTSFSYQDDIFFGANNDPLSLAEGYTLANLRLTWTSANQEWEASMFGTNITDELYVQSKLNFETSFGSIENGYGRPEEWGLSIRKHF